jgi:predicted dehydrogenase
MPPSGTPAEEPCEEAPEMERVRYAAIGCSGMGRRHLHGLARLLSSSHANIELAAVCDLDAGLANAMADEAAALTGARPQVFASIAEMVRREPGIVAANVTTDAGSHLAVSLQCFAAGLHVLCEKPLGLTVGECRAAIAAARKAGRVLSVAENFRRDPMNRLVKALIDDGAIGKPRLMLETSIGGTDLIVTTPWRHFKHTGTVVLDSGVHNADIIRYYMGEVVAIQGESRLHEPVRRPQPQVDAAAAQRDSWWGARAQLPAQTQATGEDAVYAQINFASGAVCQWVLDRAGHGLARDSRLIYGSKGSIEAPGDRNGRPVVLHCDDGTCIDDERILDFAPSYRLSPVAAELFGEARPWRYGLSFNEVDQSLLALQLHELADCIQRGVPPEVSGEEGMADVALAYAPIESGRLGRAVTLEEIIAGGACPYQDEIAELRRSA